MRSHPADVACKEARLLEIMRHQHLCQMSGWNVCLPIFRKIGHDPAVMNQTLDHRDMWHAWVLPIMAALLVGAVLVIERLQVDWTAACSMLGENVCDKNPFMEFFGWLPVPLTYGIFHIWGARRLVVGGSSAKATLMRMLALGLFIAFNLFPFPGWYLFYAGAAGGIAISLTVVGLVVAPVVGVIVAGFCAGVILGLFAGPPMASMAWSSWKNLLWGYGLGGALGAGALALGQIVFDPDMANTFGVNMPWLTALGTLGTVLSVGVITTIFACRGWVRAGLIPAAKLPDESEFAWPAALAAVLIVPVHLMVTYETTVFRRNGAPFPAVAAMLRSHKPGIPAEIALAGLTYTGPRSLVAKKEISRRARQELVRVNVGTRYEGNGSRTIYDRFEQWELYDLTRAGAENTTITADQSALQVTYGCEPGLISIEEFCLQDASGSRDHLQKILAIAYPEEAFLFSANAPDAALGIRLDARKERGPDKRNWARLYCRLNLTLVTPAKFSVMQIIPCDADWVLLAAQLRARLQRDFAPNPEKR